MTTLLRLGCQGWAHAPWVGEFFTRGARREDFLPQYATVFGAVEGNTSFYALPPREAVQKWNEEAPANFHFCFKFPKAITHERRLVHAEAETTEFFTRLERLGDRLGTFFLQLHESFGIAELPALGNYLGSLSQSYHYAVEVRHRDFFDQGDNERRLEELLTEQGVERVNFDTRGLQAATGEQPELREVQRRKPRVPLRQAALGVRPFVRFVGDPVIEKDRDRLDEWARRMARWIEGGRTPYFFAHHVDDRHSPAVARLFYSMLRQHLPRLPALPEWPAERENRERGEQLSLL